MHGGIGIGSLDQRTDRSRCSVENGGLVILDHLPETTGIRVGRDAFEDDFGRATSQRAVGDIGVTGNPTDVGGTPEDIAILDVEGVLHGQDGVQQVPASGVLNTFRLAGRTRGVEQEQRVFGFNPFRFANVRLVFQNVVQPLVTAFNHVDFSTSALEDDDVLNGIATTHGECFVSDRLERDGLTTTVLAIGSDQGNSAGVIDTITQRLGREATENDGVNRTNTSTGLHCADAFNGHRHVDDNTVTLLDAHTTQGIGKFGNLGEQLLVGHLSYFAVVGFEDQGNLVALASFDLTIQTVVRNIQLAVGKPLEERGVGLVQHLGKRFLPGDQVTGTLGPETFIIGLRFCAQRPIAIHPGNGSVLDHFLGRIIELNGLIRHILLLCGTSQFC